ncbi:MAG: hypothetical protein FWH01_14420 [Oscillospiraceae bacterium]|nr:hypothetical protein [Oscillospiraceae bacterium]
MGYGYGPGVGEGYDKIILIISRASGAPVISGAIKYAADLVKGGFCSIAAKEFESAKRAGLDELLGGRKNPKTDVEGDVKVPPKEVVTAEITGIDVMELDDAVLTLYREGIYAESGMGCTGPVILVSDANYDKAIRILER